MTNFFSKKTAYRTNAPPPPEPVIRVPFKRVHPTLYKMGTWMIGASTLSFGMFILFPGSFKLGAWIKHAIFHMGPMHPVDDTMTSWLLGLSIIVVGPVFFYLSRYISAIIFD